MDSWGYHLILDVKGCDIEKATNPDYIRDFTKELVKRIDMLPYGEPQVVHFADNTDLAGWTVLQLIHTSNITAHFCDINGDLYLDIFSCKEFDGDVVVQYLNDFFKPLRITSRFLYRTA